MSAAQTASLLLARAQLLARDSVDSSDGEIRIAPLHNDGIPAREERLERNVWSMR
jgi:hypothetical protein